MNRLQQLATRWYWGLTALLAVAALWTFATVVAQTLPERAALQSSIAELRLARQPSRAHTAAALPPAVDERDRSSAVLSVLLREAVRANVELRDIEVLASPEPARGPVAQVRVGARLNGSYADVKRVVATAMQEEPGLALDDIRITRVAQGAGVEALTQWSVYQRSTAAR